MALPGMGVNRFGSVVNVAGLSFIMVSGFYDGSKASDDDRWSGRYAAHACTALREKQP
jgi:hypothetical protein